MEEYDESGERKSENPLKIVGISVVKSGEYSGSDKFYVGEEVMERLRLDIALDNSNVKTLFDGQYYNSYSSSPDFRIVPNENVPAGQAYGSSMLNDYASGGNALNKKLVISADSI